MLAQVMLFDSFPMTTVNLTAPQAHLCYLSLDTTQAKRLQLFHSNYWPPEQYCDLHHIYLCHSFELLAAAHSRQFAVHTSCIHKALDRACSSLSRGNEKSNLLSLNRGFPKPTHFWAVPLNVLNFRYDLVLMGRD